MNTTIIIILGFLILIVVIAIIVVLAKGKDSSEKGGGGKMTFKEIDEKEPVEVKPPEQSAPQLHVKESPPVQAKKSPTPVAESKPPIQEVMTNKKSPIDNLSKPLNQKPSQIQSEPNTGAIPAEEEIPVAHPIDTLSPSPSQAESQKTEPPFVNTMDSMTTKQGTTPVQPSGFAETPPVAPSRPEPASQSKAENIPQQTQEMFQPNPLPSEDKIKSDMDMLSTAANNHENTNPESQSSIGDEGIQDIASNINTSPDNPTTPQQTTPMNDNLNQEPEVQPPQSPQQQNPVNFP